MVATDFAMVGTPSIETSIIATALPTIIGQFNSFESYAWVGTAYIVASAIATPLLGKLSDLFGRRTIILTALATFAIGSLLCGLARSMLMLIIFRGVQGAGGGAITALSFAVLGDIATPRERSRYVAYFSISFAVATLASIASIGGALAAQGFSWDDLFLNLLATSAKFASMRYADELTPTAFTQASLLSSYVATALGGLLFAGQPGARERWLIALASFVPAVLIMVTQSAKGVLFLSIAYFWGAINVCRIFNGETRLGSSEGLKQLTKATILLVPLVAFSFLARGMSETDEASDIGETLRYYFSSYMFAHLYAFSDWFGAYLGDPASLEYAPNGARFGLYTFYGLFQLLGDPPALPQGVYDEYFTVEGVFASNIYTIYRGLLMDFGLAGSLVFLLLASWLAHVVFLLLLGSKRPRFAVAAYIVMTGVFVHSFLSSLLMYNSTYATLAALWLILAFNGALSYRTTSRPCPGDVPVVGLGSVRRSADA